jgi:hypothetical protein
MSVQFISPKNHVVSFLKNIFGALNLGCKGGVGAVKLDNILPPKTPRKELICKKFLSDS